MGPPPSRKLTFPPVGQSGKFEFQKPGGAFYLFPKAPWGTGSEFAAAAIEERVLTIPGNVFSERDTHFRISFAAPDAVLEEAGDLLCKLAERGPR
jgi:aspartate aminotransferase/aminotransferase